MDLNVIILRGKKKPVQGWVVKWYKIVENTAIGLKSKYYICYIFDLTNSAKKTLSENEDRWQDLRFTVGLKRKNMNYLAENLAPIGAISKSMMKNSPLKLGEKLRVLHVLQMAP